VDFGREVFAMGTPPARSVWHLGLEDPRRPGASWGSIAVRDGRGVASSGDYVRCFMLHGRRYGHIVDPRTGWPVTNGSLQVTVVADTCLQAGVLSTAAFVLGADRGLELIGHCPGAEGVIVTESARRHTRGFYNYVVS
jgi:thiamine biosynthesis lipoprotein